MRSHSPTCPGLVLLSVLATLGGNCLGAAGVQESERRYRARELGIAPGRLATGPMNAITDVPGVRVGHCTVVEGDSIRTGVTAIVPPPVNVFRDKVRAAVFVGNGFGKLVGTTQVEELGTLETPILLTGTLSTFRVADALISWVLEQPGNEDVRSVNPVVGETNDGYLSDIRLRPLTEEHVRAALDGATTGPVAEGCVGAGTGTRCFSFKGGIGTASRVVEVAGRSWTVGVLVQTNFGGRLRILGAPVEDELRRSGETRGSKTPRGREAAPSDAEPEPQDGSCMIVVATDAPLDARQLRRMARRAVFGMGRVGASYSQGSGDYAIAFSTELARSRAGLDDAALTPLFEATLEGVEEAILNALFQATSTTGMDGRRSTAIPFERVVDVCRRHGIPAFVPDGD